MALRLVQPLVDANIIATHEAFARTDNTEDFKCVRKQVMVPQHNGNSAITRQRAFGSWVAVFSEQLRRHVVCTPPLVHIDIDRRSSQHASIADSFDGVRCATLVL
jgi:hypothetical protein